MTQLQMLKNALLAKTLATGNLDKVKHQQTIIQQRQRNHLLNLIQFGLEPQANVGEEEQLLVKMFRENILELYRQFNCLNKGTLLIAKDELKMRNNLGCGFIVGRIYEVLSVEEGHCYLKSEVTNNHSFDLDDASPYFYGKWFDILKFGDESRDHLTKNSEVDPKTVALRFVHWLRDNYSTQIGNITGGATKTPLSNDEWRKDFTVDYFTTEQLFEIWNEEQNNKK